MKLGFGLILKPSWIIYGTLVFIRFCVLLTANRANAIYHTSETGSIMDSSLDSDLVNCKMVESLYTQNKRLFPFSLLFPFPQNIPRKGEEKEVGFTKNEEKD